MYSIIYKIVNHIKINYLNRFPTEFQAALLCKDRNLE